MPSSYVIRLILIVILGGVTLYLTLLAGLHIGRTVGLADAHNLCLRPIGITLEEIRDHYDKGRKDIAEAKFRYLADNWFTTQLLPGKPNTDRTSLSELLLKIDEIGKDSIKVNRASQN